MPTKNNKYHIITFGCQMNKSDSERVAAVLEHVGYRSMEKPEEADLIVINACSVRQAAIDRIWGLVKNYDEAKLSRKLTTILTGCLLDKDKERLGAKFDFVFNIKDLSSLEKWLHDKVAVEDDYLEVLPKYSSKFSAYVPIMTGCNNFCSYCAVPYARGREVSRSVKSILKEIKHLAKNGCKEIVLLGQNVNSFAPSDLNTFKENNPFKHAFAALLWEVNKIRGLDRVMFTAAHPKDMTAEVIEALALPKMMNYIHLALQSGDDDVLKKMNRRYTADHYCKIIEKIRKVRPEIALGTDIIEGFPGETRKQFENTLKFYRKVNFDIAYHAMYSPRVGTVAAKMADDVTREEKKRRWHELQTLMMKMTKKINQKYLNKTVEVLVDKKTGQYCEGNSREMKRVRFAGNAGMGEIVLVKITKAQEWLLSGEIQDRSA